MNNNVNGHSLGHLDTLQAMQQQALGSITDIHVYSLLSNKDQLVHLQACQDLNGSSRLHEKMPRHSICYTKKDKAASRHPGKNCPCARKHTQQRPSTQVLPLLPTERYLELPSPYVICISELKRFSNLSV